MDNEMWDIVAARLHGEELTPEEAYSLREWLSVEANRRVLEKLEAYYMEHASLRTVGRTAVDDAWRENVVRLIGKKRESRRRIFCYGIYAASIIVLCAVAVSVLFGGGEKQVDETPLYQSEKIQGGSSKAVLTLASGETVTLGENKGVVASEKTGVANNYGNVLEYKTRDSAVVTYLEFNRIDIPRGGEYQLVLEDGTKVWLNSETSLKYPVVFGSGRRRVFLEGEAYFQVKQDRDRPFVVCVASVDVLALGTEFNVTFYKEGDAVYTTLVHGCVKVSERDNPENFQVLESKEQAVYTPGAGKIVKSLVDTRLFASWKDGYYMFDKENLENIMVTLSRWYDMDVLFMNGVVRSYKFTGRLKRYDNIINLLNIINLTNDVNFEVKGKTVIVSSK